MSLVLAQLLIESRAFSSWLNEKVIRNIVKKNNIQFNFDRIDLDLFGNKIMLNGVQASSEEGEFFGRIGFGINADIFFSRKLIISRIVVDDGKFTVKKLGDKNNSGDHGISMKWLKSSWIKMV